MYTVDCLYLNKEALKLKKTVENNWKSIQSMIMYVMFHYYMETKHYL